MKYPYLQSKEKVKSFRALAVGNHIDIIVDDKQADRYLLNSVIRETDKSISYIASNDKNTLMFKYDLEKSAVVAKGVRIPHAVQTATSVNIRIKKLHGYTKDHDVVSKSDVGERFYHGVYAEKRVNKFQILQNGDTFRTTRGEYTVEYVCNDNSIIAIDKKGRTCFFSSRDADFRKASNIFWATPEEVEAEEKRYV